LVRLSRFNGDEFFVNAELIETIEKTPDTIISLTTGKKLLVKESAEDVVSRVLEYKRRIAGAGRVEAA
jgi:flagellar protein FlbD